MTGRRTDVEWSSATMHCIISVSFTCGMLGLRLPPKSDADLRGPERTRKCTQRRSGTGTPVLGGMSRDNSNGRNRMPAHLVGSYGCTKRVLASPSGPYIQMKISCHARVNATICGVSPRRSSAACFVCNVVTSAGSWGVMGDAKGVGRCVVVFKGIGCRGVLGRFFMSPSAPL